MKTPSLPAPYVLLPGLQADLVLMGGLIAVAWSIALVATLTGHDHWLHYDAFFHHPDQSLLLTLLSFLTSWQVMIVAMMLPTSLPLIRLFVKLSQQHSVLTLLVFLAAYFTLWTGFAVLAFVSGWGLHQVIQWVPWLRQNPWFISGVTLLLAGLFQVSDFKNHCLTVCRHPFSFLTHHYQQGLQGAWNLGLRHGIYCLGCCWALMVVMFVIGSHHLAWMLALTGVMLLERTTPWGQKLIPIVAIILIDLGAALLLQPVSSSSL